MNTFVVSEFPVAHVTVILDDFAYMLGRKILKTYQNLRAIDKS